MAALREGNAKAAVLAFTAAVAADPTSGALQRNLASAHRLAGDDSGELNALEAALALDRRDLMAWLRKAELHQRNSDKGPALEAWSAAVQLAEPLRPWTGPIAEALGRGALFLEQANQAIRSSIGEVTGSLASELDQTERRRAAAFVDMALGQRQRFTNQCAGLCYPFLPADEFFDDRHFPWFATLSEGTQAIRTELTALLEDPGESLRPYVRMDAGSPDNLWSGLDNSLDWGACFLWEYGEPNAPVIERCPKTVEILSKIPSASLPNRSPNVFFSMLKPRTRIPPHTGVTNTRAIIHLPLIVPEGCGFRVGGETRQWVEGQPFAFDDTIEHEAWNDSDQLRAVLILDVWNPHLTDRERQFIAQYYAAADKTGYHLRRDE